MDIFERIQRKEEPTSKMARQLHGYFTYPKLEGPLGPHMRFRGKDVINWNTNDYLGFSQNPEIQKIDEELTRKWGLAYPSGNRIMSGNTAAHEELESKLAEMTQKEDAFVLNYGYQGFFSIVDALCDKNDIIVYDSNIHASMIDGIRLHRGWHVSYPHNDMDALEKILQKSIESIKKDKDNGGILLITQGIFGTLGEYGNLKSIVELKKKYDFRILLNDADGFGIEGATGAGTGEHFGINKQIDLYLGSFSKAFASLGGFIAGPENILNYLRYHTRTQTHSKALPIVYTIGMSKRIDYLQQHLSLIKQLHKNAHSLRVGLVKGKLDLGQSNTSIIPVYLHCNIYEAINIVMELRENYNIFCPVLIYPFIPKDQLLLRLLPSVSHSMEDIDFTIKAFENIQSDLLAQKYATDHSDFLNEEV